jgi:hypothetical protein
MGGPMINETKFIQGTIEPAVAGDMLCRAWENRAGIVGAPLAALKTDGKAFEIMYLLWDTENLKHTLLTAVQKVAPQAQVTWKKSASSRMDSRSRVA